jgi:energy-coupling factor transporter transmembrane protein EcfT
LAFTSYLAFFAGWAGLAAAASILAAAAAVGRIGPRRLFAGSASLFTAAALIVLVRAFSWTAASGWRLEGGEWDAGLRFAAGLVAAFASGSLLFATATTWELRAALSRGQTVLIGPPARWLAVRRADSLRRLGAALAAFDLSLLFALTLGFLPRVFQVWETAVEARRARAGRTGPAALAGLLTEVVERLMEAAADTALAVEARSAAD